MQDVERKKNRIRKNAWSGIHPCIDSAFSILRFFSAPSPPLFVWAVRNSGSRNCSPLLWSDAQPQERLLSCLLSIINLCYSCKSKTVLSSLDQQVGLIDVEDETKPNAAMLSKWLILARTMISEVEIEERFLEGFVRTSLLLVWANEKDFMLQNVVLALFNTSSDCPSEENLQGSVENRLWFQIKPSLIKGWKPRILNYPKNSYFF